MSAVHALTCPVRRRWRRWRTGQPFWRDDKTAQMLGVAHLGCHRCGEGMEAHLIEAARAESWASDD